MTKPVRITEAIISPKFCHFLSRDCCFSWTAASLTICRSRSSRAFWSLVLKRPPFCTSCTYLRSARPSSSAAFSASSSEIFPSGVSFGTKGSYVPAGAALALVAADSLSSNNRFSRSRLRILWGAAAVAAGSVSIAGGGFTVTAALSLLSVPGSAVAVARDHMGSLGRPCSAAKRRAPNAATVPMTLTRTHDQRSSSLDILGPDNLASNVKGVDVVALDARSLAWAP
mmetsp:Transcript_56695/g.101061  ORF Transcript_56695/g.101061 Transcript_56695/m.101061 type:complete len:227 (-) Transcript_56695:351-1031(-)